MTLLNSQTELVGDEDGVLLARSNAPVKQRTSPCDVIICGSVHNLLRESINLENLRVKQVPDYETESTIDMDCYRRPLTAKQRTMKLLRRKQQTSSRRSNRK